MNKGIELSLMNENNHKDNLPGISVIVPVYNAAGCIAGLIESLLGQDYPKELIEIIIVDNNSDDQTKEIVKQYPVILLEENEIQSSYAARTKGIKYAHNDILAFTDSDCKALKNWITEGVKTLESSNADIVGGKVEFVFSNNKTAAEMYDSIIHMQTELNTKNNSAPTANLFTRVSLFDKIGMFQTVKSGGDFLWTSLAVSKGCLLSYCSEAIVQHPTRKLKELLKKRFRTALGSVSYWRQTGMSRWQIAMMAIRKFLPRRLCYIRKAIERSGSENMKKKLISIFWVAWLCNIVSASATLISMLRASSKKN